MLCPYCRHENLEGADFCESCLTDFHSLTRPQSETPLEDSLINEAVASLGPKPTIMVEQDATVREAIETMVTNNIGCVLVAERGRVVGILSERDLLLRVALRLPEAESEPVARYMTPDPLTLDLGAPLAYALNYMTLRDFRHLPLTDEGRLAGIISLRDFLGLLFRSYPDIAAPASGR